MKKVIFLFLFMFIFVSFFYAAEKAANTNLKDQYNKEKITFVTKEEFDVLYPVNINKFDFYQGDKKLTLDEFVKVSNDPVLIKNQEKVKRIKIAGFSTAIVFGIVTTGFFIPSVIYIAKMANYSTYDKNYAISGVIMFAFMCASLAGLFIDLIVTFSLIHKFQYSVQAVRQAVETYNENLRKRLGILPDMSFNDSKINFTLDYRF